MQLWQLVRLVSERYGKRLQEHKKARPGSGELDAMTVQQFQYLQAVNRFPSATVGGLAAYFRVTSPTVTVAVNRLVRAGFLKKSPSNVDGRSNLLVLTQKGRKVLRVQEGAFRALAEDISRALDENELGEYFRLTKKVCDSLD